MSHAVPLPAPTAAPRVPLSILDLSPISVGTSGSQAIRNSIELARHADLLGYHRFWFAEHHLSPGVAAASPAVLAALVAQATERIRVGSGATLLATTSPIVAAEQYASIAAVAPGRVDLGVGRSSISPSDGSGPARAAGGPARTPSIPGPRVVDGLRIPAAPPFDLRDETLRRRLDGHRKALAVGRDGGDFDAELRQILALREGAYQDGEGRSYVSPVVRGAEFDLWVLASSGGESARVAGRLGLPLAANFHVSPATVLDTVASYREAFVPGVLAEPYVVVSADVLVAPTAEEAERLGEPFARWVLSIRGSESGSVEYPAPGSGDVADWSPEQLALVEDRVSTRVVGDAEQVVGRLETLQAATGADELLITTIVHDHADRLRSYELLARAWAAPAASTPDLVRTV